MGIEEKQKALEFTFTPDNIEGDLQYDIVYDDTSAFSLNVSAGGSVVSYPLELFVDVVDFLTSKGIIKPKILSRTAPTPGIAAIAGHKSSAGGESIPIPQIEKKDGTKAPVQVTANVDPLASFDIDVEAMGNANVAPAPVMGSGPVIVSKEATPKEAITRPVIRSRVRDGEPLSAEKDAANLRAAQTAASGKTIKKAHRTGE